MQINIHTNFNVDIQQNEVNVVPVKEISNDPNWGTAEQ